MKAGWVLEADIRKFFDTLDHTHLMTILRRRVRDGVLLRLIGKWLNAGVLENGELSYPEAGSPQGGVISPILANIYLHEVMDEWFEGVVKPRLKGRTLLVRYADDFVLFFSRRDDARRVLEVLPKRFGKYGLALHPDKTRLVPFRRPAFRARQVGLGQSRPGTFSLLGFTHYWMKSRRGNWVIKQRTASDRFTRALVKIARWCRDNRHRPVRWQWQVLNQKLRGHFGYYGITGNFEAIARFYREVRRVWRKWLHRRSQRARMSWDRMEALLERYPLPQPRIMRDFDPAA
jgi:group II intron reverse transcriptase/maturase